MGERLNSSFVRYRRVHSGYWRVYVGKRQIGSVEWLGDEFGWRFYTVDGTFASEIPAYCRIHAIYQWPGFTEDLL